MGRAQRPPPLSAPVKQLLFGVERSFSKRALGPVITFLISYVVVLLYLFFAIAFEFLAIPDEVAMSIVLAVGFLLGLGSGYFTRGVLEAFLLAFATFAGWAMNVYGIRSPSSTISERILETIYQGVIVVTPWAVVAFLVGLLIQRFIHR